MNYAEVAVNSPIAQRRSFCYSIPPELNVDIGQAVWVPFGSQILQGIVVEVSDYPSFEATKDINDVITPFPLLSSSQIEVALWLSKHYLAPLFSCVALMLPPAFERRLVTFLEGRPDIIDTELTLDQKHFLHLLEGRGKVDLKEVERELGKKKTESVAQQLLRRGLVSRSQQLEAARMRPKLVSRLKLLVDRSRAETEAVNLRTEGAIKEASVLNLLADKSGEVPLSEVRKYVVSPKIAIESLKSRGMVSVEEVVERRDPLAHLSIRATQPPELSPSQQVAWQELRSCLSSEDGNKASAVFLLHGVTGSGKTELYLRALTQVVAQGRKGICLVPEISLTPQTIERFASRFPGRVAVIHSGLSLGEQFDEWHRIKDGSCDVVIGARSALFAPQSDLGLIVIDEEHEWTYKQSDKSPRYHARDTAIKLAEFSNAMVILGSATPDVCTYYRAQCGNYHLVELKERITPYGSAPLPEVNIIDMREELKAGNGSLFSRSLMKEMTEALAGHGQVILFLNRRGAATFVQCRKCGFVFHCRRCTGPLTYHSVTRKLVCHHCNYSISVPVECPQCLNAGVRFLGIGTQKVEEEVSRLFPEARVLRWDSDMTARRHAHEELMNKMKSREVDILIGTQMVAKGLDLPQVTLAGVISADTSLNLPDFRAGERTFQLLCQVAGRAGRGFMPGKVVIQTYCPEHYAIQAAEHHDYSAFYNKELEYRRAFGYPPFGELASLTFSHTNNKLCFQEVQRMASLLTVEKERKGIPGSRLIGPVPAFVPRLRGQYRWQLVVCGVDLDEFLADIPFPRGWMVDIDPVSMV
jgi:primosomal protein N' (replication factor Y)